jgi:hypothetical protein
VKKLGIIIFLLVVGCAVQNPSQFVGRIQNGAQGIRDDLKAARPHADQQGQQHMDRADQKAEQIIEDAKQIQKAMAAKAKACQKDHDALMKLEGSVGVKVERIIWNWIFWIKWGSIAVVGLYIAGGIYGAVGTGGLATVVTKNFPAMSIFEKGIGFVKWVFGLFKKKSAQGE